jgi:nitrate reductase / nitrite oxidoreductase, beta subunit
MAHQEVYNWQLGRKMAYPYKEKHPKWQFAFVFNINRCIACQTCTMACKSTWTFSKGQEFMWWNRVEHMPYGGYPQSWDKKILHMLEQENPGRQRWAVASTSPEKPYGIYDGMTIFEGAVHAGTGQMALGYVPTDKEWRAPNFYEDTATGYPVAAPDTMHEGSQLPHHKTWFFYLARLCNHCTYPGCLGACPRKAIYKREEDGIVLIDQSRCRGYRKCVEQCPYKLPMFRGTTRVSEKCIACYPRIEGKDPVSVYKGTKGPHELQYSMTSPSQNDPMETRCMAVCVGQIRLQGLVQIGEDGKWVHDPENPLYYLIRVAKVALPIYPVLGTEPNGYYIPPRHVPKAYLRQMFGPGADHAVEAFMNPTRDLLACMNLFRKHQSIIFKFKRLDGPKVFENPNFHGKKYELYNDTVVAYNKEGKELFRTPIEEPTYIRRGDIHYNTI